MDDVVQLENEETKEMRYKISSKIKELEKLYSWSQFYQDRNLRNKVKVAQSQIRDKKQDLVELKNEFKKKKKK